MQWGRECQRVATNGFVFIRLIRVYPCWSSSVHNPPLLSTFYKLKLSPGLSTCTFEVVSASTRLAQASASCAIRSQVL